MWRNYFITLSLLCNLACFLADLFQIFLLLKNSFRNTFRVSNSLDPDQAWHFVRPDMGPDSLQMLLADNNSK